jgi:hypothetical protein
MVGRALKSLNRDFGYANLLEVSGKADRSAGKISIAATRPGDQTFSFKYRVDDAVKRLSQR